MVEATKIGSTLSPKVTTSLSSTISSFPYIKQIIFLIILVNLNTIPSLPQINALPLDDLSSLYNTRNDQEAPQCRYSSCPKLDPTKINVHIIPHTHDDVGWLKTVDQYYFGTKKQFNSVGVSYILDSVIPELVMDKSKRFIYVEIAFFSRWWNEQNEKMKKIVRQLVNEGRFEFINGGWCMNDEATTSYQSIIEQMTLGLRFLNETFGVCGRPKVGWQIDPFGHSNEQASLFAQFGFDGMYFSRANYYDKLMRTKHKSLDMIWHGDRALEGQSGSIFTNMFRDTYESPNGFCFDVSCLDDSIVDNPKSYENNIKTKALEYIEYVRNYAKAKLTSNVLIPFGGDFQFSAADQNFKNMDKLIAYISKNANDLNLFYSTPTCYQLALFNSGVEKKIKWPEKYDDFMPYESTATIWWSGYFSSRPSVKLIERETVALLTVARLSSAKHLLSTSKQSAYNSNNKLKNHEEVCLTPLWQVLGDLQHHDAITGTEKQHVANDYVRRVSDASIACTSFMGNFRRSVIDSVMNKSSPVFIKLKNSAKQANVEPIFLEKTQLCPLLNISQCSPLEAKFPGNDFIKSLSSSSNTSDDKVILDERLKTKSVLMTAYNPLSRVISQHDFRIPCNEPCELDKVRVIHLASNETLKIIRLPVPAGILNLPFRESVTNYEILFYSDLPALGYTSFLIEDSNEEEPQSSSSSANNKQPPASEEKSSRETRDLSDVKRQSRSSRYEYFTSGLSKFDSLSSDKQKLTIGKRSKRDAWDNEVERVVVKFDMATGMIVGLRRSTDGTYVNITQKFGYYYPAEHPSAGAYIFRPNISEPIILDKPQEYKIYRRKNGRLIEIQQKWNDWIWQTIRVDARKSYIEFDHVIGPIPTSQQIGKEVITRYESNLDNGGVFFTDSNSRQLMMRKSRVVNVPEELGGSFYPVTSTLALRNVDKSNKSADFLAILTDRSQAGASMQPGHLELLVHRRILIDDRWGVEEALNEPGEDSRGLVTRGKHRLYLKFGEDIGGSSKSSTYSGPANQSSSPQGLASTSTSTSASQTTNNQSPSGGALKPSLYELPRTPNENLTYARNFVGRNISSHLANSNTNNNLNENKGKVPTTYIIHDSVIDNLRLEATKFALQPVVTFDKLRSTADEFMDLFINNQQQNGTNSFISSAAEFEHSFLNLTPPSNIHVLTFQPWQYNSWQLPQQQQQPQSHQFSTLLLRFENLDNPLTVHPLPDISGYENIVKVYNKSGLVISDDEYCGPRTEFEAEFLLHKIKIVKLEELTLGANSRLAEDKRFDWTREASQREPCDKSGTLTSSSRLRPTLISLGPRQIRTFLAHYDQNF